MSSKKSRKRRHHSNYPSRGFTKEHHYNQQNRAILFLANQINAGVSEALREKRKGMNPAAIVIFSQIEDENKYPSDFKLMMDRIWRSVRYLRLRREA